MRRQLIIGAAAVAATVLIAFVVPLGLAVRALAENRAVAQAEQTAQSVATVLALTDDRRVTTDAVVAAQARTSARLTVYLEDGGTLGAGAPRNADVDRAFGGASFASDGDHSRNLYVPATRAEGTVAVVRAQVPFDQLRRGVSQSWLLLGGLGVVLLLAAVAMADRLGRSFIGPVRSLALTARQVSSGNLAARVEPAGPPEVADVGTALNGLTGRINELLAAERETVADLSHRLRTPLTALRLDADAVASPADRQRLRADVDALEVTVTELIREAREPSQQPPAEPLDLVPIVRERAAYWGALADDQDRRWTLSITPEALPVRLRQREAEALLDVLLDNIFSHTPEGTAYAVFLEDGCLVVEDEGPGFANATAAERGHSAAGSTGLGLDIVRQVAERSGGALNVGQRGGGGGRVEVRFGAAARAS